MKKPVIFCTKQRRMAGTDNLHTKVFANSYRILRKPCTSGVRGIRKHRTLEGGWCLRIRLCVCVCVCVCVLVSGCVVSLSGLRVCILVSSGGAKIHFSCLRVIHMK
jgi:hypothetical protein